METTTKTAKSICFAYFADGKFIGWYADSFGSIRKDSPKLYSNTELQIQTITNNFRLKLDKIGKTSNLGSLVNGLDILDNSINQDKSTLSQYKEIKLRIVECSEYDGMNPDFDKSKYEEEIAEHKQLMTDAGIFDIHAPSKERTDAVNSFHEKHPRPKCDNWIYADYSKVKEWAKNEPTEFIGKITY